MYAAILALQSEYASDEKKVLEDPSIFRKFHQILHAAYTQTPLKTFPKHAANYWHTFAGRDATRLEQACLAHTPPETNKKEWSAYVRAVCTIIPPSLWVKILVLKDWLPVHDRLFLPFALYLHLLEEKDDKDVSSIAAWMTDLCNARDMTIPMFFAEVHMRLHHARENSTDLSSHQQDLVRYLSKLVLTQEELEHAIEEGLRNELGRIKEMTRSTLTQLKDMPVYLLADSIDAALIPKLLTDYLVCANRLEPYCDPDLEWLLGTAHTYHELLNQKGGELMKVTDPRPS
jgi:hypothetical protein